LAAAASGFSTAGVGGDGEVGVEDDAVGAAAGVSSLRKFSLYFVFASSAAGGTGLAGTAGLSALASAKDGNFSATGDGGVGGAGLGDGAAGAGVAVVGATAEGSSRNLSLMSGLAVAGAD
jgi:hypothetical protein